MNKKGEKKKMGESFASLKLAYLIAFILIFTLLVSQFNSYFQPLAIMTALPLSVVGAMLGLLVTGNNVSFDGVVGQLFALDTAELVRGANLDEAGRARYIVAIPTLPEQERIEEERARTLAYLFGALLLVVGGSGSATCSVIVATAPQFPKAS